MNNDEPNNRNNPKRTVFVTVGTTLFDPLIQVISSPTFLHKILSQGYNNLIIQYGRGESFLLPNKESSSPLHLDGITKHSTAAGQGLPQMQQQEGIYMDPVTGKRLSYEMYPFKNSLHPDMKQAQLIISHAGAGSIMEGLTHVNTFNEKLLIHCGGSSTPSSPPPSCHRPPPPPPLLKRLVVVINDQLMDNHQRELAEAMSKSGYLMMLASPNLLLESHIMDEIEAFQPVFYSGGNLDAFGDIVNYFEGLNEDLAKKK